MLTSYEQKKDPALLRLVVWAEHGQCVEWLGTLVMTAVKVGCADCFVAFGKVLDSSEPQSCSCKTGITNAFIL